jgi:hypothetical protein
LITFWTQLSASHEFGRGPIPGLVREKSRAAPELAEVIDDLSVIEKHRGVAVIVGSGVGMLAWSSWRR